MMNLNEMSCGVWVPDAVLCDRSSKNNFTKHGRAILKRWHEQCAERRRIAAMSEKERLAHFRRTDPYERAIASFDRAHNCKRKNGGGK